MTTSSVHWWVPVLIAAIIVGLTALIVALAS